MEKKTCPGCKKILDLSEFYVRIHNGRPSAYCKRCTKDRSIAWQQKNGPRDMTATMLKHRYGITLERYTELLMEQGEVCAVCGNPETKTLNGKVNRLSVDHDHACCPGKRSCGKCIRGLLCDRCNGALAKVDDDPARLRDLATYVEKHRRL